ncbi:GHKL domain-containing protein [Lacihabitans sp. LS3-19]|uniref:tetratricopeptide repeat-containing sensor histidine kinase n=1 Tax=Lacihabitans sp. LS3-19 TaxID=2487335 RepID=UPI0020CE93F5|nr:tetratricopeptide repeat-containing sensor histidine kinase [Lacihabitans sp. LS3-19]MCP9768334.1 GHKL domain-containing protein [Lacihabitans sp. LS3-19]
MNKSFPETLNYSFLFLLIFSFKLQAQTVNKAYIDSLIITTQYLGADESKADSLILMGDLIEKKGKEIGYKKGFIYGYRFKGWAYDYKGQYDKAIAQFLMFLKVAKMEGFVDEEIMAYGDLGGLYSFMGRHEDAKKTFQLATNNAKFRKEQPRRLSTFYNNLGLTYRKLGLKDSALLMYQQSMKLKEEVKDTVGLLNLKTNLSVFLMEENKLAEAEKMIVENIVLCKKLDKKGDLWHNYLNYASLKSKQGKTKEAEEYYNRANQLANELDNDPFRNEIYEAQAAFYEKTGNFKKALEMQQAAKEVAEKILNQQTNEKISELRETFNAEEKERINKLLNAELTTKKTQQGFLIVGISMLLLLAGIIAFALQKNRKKNQQLAHQNDLITLQKDKLTELNEEKNSLISIVSHDLRSPFNTILMWAETLEANLEKSKEKAKESLAMIRKSALMGEEMVGNILDVEKMEINTHQLDLKEINLVELSQELIADFAPAASGKNIEIKFDSTQKEISHLTDQSLLRRALENLLSNALKFSHPDSEVDFSISKKEKQILFQIKDYGVGIPKEEQHKIFSKYGRTSASPTSDESSTGLGLSIVKRISEELGGEVWFTSEINKGSEFVFSLSI